MKRSTSIHYCGCLVYCKDGTQNLATHPTTVLFSDKKKNTKRKRLLSVSVESPVSLRASTVTVFVYQTWGGFFKNPDQNVVILLRCW